jgi:HlyD family secretion protein
VKRKWKILLVVVVVLVAAGTVYGIRAYNQRGIVAVQTGRVVRQDLTSIVTASGEIKPKNYVNIGANAMGDLTEILVKEGDRVRKGQLLAKVESVQAAADMQAQKAGLASAEADSAAAEATLNSQDDNLRVAQATIQRSKADLEHAKLDFDRGEQLYKAKLIAKQDYDQRKSAYDSSKAALDEATGRYEQAKAQREQAVSALSSAQKRITQSQAMLRRLTDVLEKHDSMSPIDGVVTNLPVRVGETVVPGIQNSTASLIMTIADMSLITAEVKVDETDIVNVQLGQAADITVDAMPNRIFKGHVTEIGNTAIVRSTGLAASQSTVSSQEAKDFKVVIALDNPPDEMRPGLSCTSKITTATRQAVLSIPIQALTVRQKGDLEKGAGASSGGAAQAATKLDPAAEKARKVELQGVFAISGDKAVFHKVDTGITGATDIEVTGGLKEGDEIVTGSYKVIRTLRNEARIKVDNQAPVKTD